MGNPFAIPAIIFFMLGFGILIHRVIVADTIIAIKQKQAEQLALIESFEKKFEVSEISGHQIEIKEWDEAFEKLTD